MSKFFYLLRRTAFWKEINVQQFKFSSKPTNEALVDSVRSMYKSKDKPFQPSALLFLAVPVAAFALGTWQIERKKWKENLIEFLNSRISLDPVELPEDLSELSDMEYCPVHVRGTFLHSKEQYIGPRLLMLNGPGSNTGHSIFNTGQIGFHVVTPLKLENRNLTVLVNRGWVKKQEKNPRTRRDGQIRGVVDIVGLVRHTEPRETLKPPNNSLIDYWLWRDVEKMAEKVGAAPVFLDALAWTSVPDGPIGGQTVVNLRNNHFSYILTWYALSAATAFMWLKRFILKKA